MRIARPIAVSALFILTTVCATTSTSAAPVAPAATPLALAQPSHAVEAGYRRWYRDLDDDDYDYPPEYYLPPPPPPPPAVRVYRYAPPPPIVEYAPPVYGWMYPPRPANCGKYRYWNGERCADARYDPPYTGPRW